MINWLKRYLGITELERENIRLRSYVERHERYVDRKVEELKDYTRVDADIGIRGNNTIVLTGVYKNQGFVRFYDIGDGEFKKLVDQMDHMRDHCLIRHIDKPLNFHGTFDLGRL